MILLSVSSGTSADGVDVGLVDVSWDPDGDVVLGATDTWTEPWPDGLAERVLALLRPRRTTAAELCALDTAVGQAVGRAAAAAAGRAAVPPELVVSPGQTVHHEVVADRCLGTLQIGQPAWVVEATGLPVVSDLRARDVAAGGHGAPLASTLDALWLRPGSAALNLGGIANVTVLGDDGSTLAWDTGPANCLIDVAAGRASGGAVRYDRDGALARSGRVDEALLARLRAHPYYAAPPPVSTGRETFSAAYLDEMLGAAPVAHHDVLSTVTELTAVTVAAALGPHRVREVVASGGGTANGYLMERLAHHLGGVRLRTSDELGIPAGGKEAVLWALLGFLTWHGVPASTPATGAAVPRVLGRISPGDAPLVLPPPVRRAPRRLHVRSGDPALEEAR
ncbi:MAG: anhydro-N-acetylmuramic acid kinase [Nocardioidaceae bacterium]